jgi:hypothetical protein
VGDVLLKREASSTVYMFYDLYVCRLEELVGDVLVKREASSAALTSTVSR